MPDLGGGLAGCYQCAYVWRPRTARRRTCPRCKSTQWDVPRPIAPRRSRRPRGAGIEEVLGPPPGSTPRADGRIRSDPTPRVRICRPRRSRTPERPRPARRVCGPAGRAAADGVRGTARGAPRAPGRPRDRGELALAPSAPRPGGSRPGRGDEALPRCDARLPPWEVGFGLPTGSPAHPKPGAAISPEIIRVRTRTRRNNHPARASHPSRHRHPRHFPGLGVAAPSYGRRSSASRPRRARRRSGSHRTVRRTPPA